MTPKTQKKEEDIELMELLSPARSIDLRIRRIFDELPDKFVVMLLEKLNEYSLANTRILNFFTKQGMNGVYVSTNKPMCSLAASLKKANVDCGKIFFVDAITKLTGEEALTAKNIVYVDSPKNLIDMSVAIETGTGQTQGEKKFVIIDSLSTLLVYNKPEVVEKFVHSIAGKIRAWKARGVFLMMKGTQDKVTKTIGQFCDKTIEL